MTFHIILLLRRLAGVITDISEQLDETFYLLIIANSSYDFDLGEVGIGRNEELSLKSIKGLRKFDRSALSKINLQLICQPSLESVAAMLDASNGNLYRCVDIDDFGW